MREFKNVGLEMESLEHNLVTNSHLLFPQVTGFKPLLLASGLPALFIHTHTQSCLNG